MSYTPGPWRIVDHSWSDVGIYAERDRRVCAVELAGEYNGDREDDSEEASERMREDSAERDSNARLIAAAPELLKACKRAAADHEKCVEHHQELSPSTYQALIDAIEKVGEKK